MSTATYAPPALRILPAGEYRAEQISIGTRIQYGSRDVGRVTRIEQCLAVPPSTVEAVRTGHTDQVPGFPILRFEVACSGGRSYYFVRFPHEPVQIIEVA
jgi:hypothetical protein